MIFMLTLEQPESSTQNIPGNEPMAIQPGLYEQLITQALKKEPGNLDNGLKSITSPVDPGESHIILAQHMEQYLSIIPI